VAGLDDGLADEGGGVDELMLAGLKVAKAAESGVDGTVKK
jgi:hypothetical protein